MFGLTSGTNMTGLNNFIAEIRACKDKESEMKRTENQLAKIREKFTTEKGLSAYHRKKYVWKLLYIHILGYEVDFGFHEAASLINSRQYDQKYTGYIASSLLINQKNQEIWKAIVHSVESDLLSKNEASQSLAFSMIATILPDILINALSEIVVDIATSSKYSTNIRKKAIMCMARVIKKVPNKFDPKKYVSAVSDMFEPKHVSLSFQSASASLLLTLMSHCNPEIFKEVQPKVARMLHKLAINKQCSMDYLYYSTPNPWLQMKLYKLLQIWSPPQEKGILSLVEEILSKVMKRTDTSKSINKNNTEFGLLFEVINLIIHYDQKVDPKLLNDVSKILVVFISSIQANTRYLGLEAMCRLAIRHNLAQHQTKILSNLDDADISIRRRALELLYLICNSSNVTQIVGELLGYLQNRNDPLILDDLVLKIAVLTEKFAQNLIWYVDMVVKLIKNAEVENDIWYRILQIITGFGNHNVQLQNYAAKRLYSSMLLPHVTNTMKCVGSYVISQFSDYLIKDGKEPQKIFDCINKHFQTANSKSKSMMLNAYAKLGVKYDVLRQQVQMIFHMCSQHWDPNVQQRGVEFTALFNEDQTIQKKVLSQNPAFTQQQQLANPIHIKVAKGSRIKQTTSNPSKSKVNAFQSVSAVENNVGGHPLANHPFFKKALDRLCPNQVNLLDVPGKLDLKPYWKEALVKKTPFQGVELKEKLQDNVLKIILVVGAKTTQMQFKIIRSKGFEVTHSPIKYGPQHQQIMLVLTPNNEKIQPPSVGIAWKNQSGQITKKQIQLPVTISKFLNPIQLTYDKFNNFYNQFSLPSDKFYKIDTFIKIPDAIKVLDFHKKIGSFLSSVCNFKCNAHPSFNDIKVIYGSAAFSQKEGDKNISIPILIETQGYESDKQGVLRVSLRGGNGNVLVSMYQLIAAFF